MCLTLLKCLDNLSKLCLKDDTPYSKKDLNELNEIFITLKDHGLKPSDINNWFNLLGSNLRFECLWQLQSYNLIQFTSFLYFNADSVDRLSADFEILIWCQDDDVRDSYSQCVATLLCVLVNLGGHTPREICKPGLQFLKLVIKKFVDRLLRDPLSAEEPVPFLPRLLGHAEAVPSRLRAFCLSLLRAVVQAEPDAVSVEEAIQEQAEKYTTNGSHHALLTQTFAQEMLGLVRSVMKTWLSGQEKLELLSNIKRVVTKLPAEDTINEIIFCITSLQGHFNWCRLLMAVSVFINLSNQGIDYLKGVTEGWVVEACSSKNSQLLASALLVARQCCAESSSKFCPYSAWFGGLQLRPASAFMFFFEYLSKLVPYEPVLYLKIHVNKVPSPPPNCHGVVADYVTLAKTRLADLKQTTDYIGLFGEYTTSEQEGRKSDVRKVISHFKQTKEVMKIVLEASVFRRQFYEEVFLVELLRENNEDNTGLIEKLYSLGKIPHGMYSRWRQAFSQ